MLAPGGGAARSGTVAVLDGRPHGVDHQIHRFGAVAQVGLPAVGPVGDLAGAHDDRRGGVDAHEAVERTVGPRRKQAGDRPG